jgi:hypothetical protein
VDWIVDNIHWIMLVSGILTATMIFAAIAPQMALRATFGETLEGPLVEVVVRNWGAFDEPSRPVILVFAAATKLIFIALVVAQGTRYLRRQAGIAVIADLIMVVLFASYLVAVSG